MNNKVIRKKSKRAKCLAKTFLKQKSTKKKQLE